MSAKVTISYEKPEELEKILDRLAPMIKSYKISSGQKGRYKKAYADLCAGIEGSMMDLSAAEFLELYGQKPEKT